MSSEINHLDVLIERYPVLEPCKVDILNAYRILERSYHSDGKLLICGNGGSAADSEHIVGELMKGFIKKRPVNDPLSSLLKKDERGEYMTDKLQIGLPAIALTCHQALITAFANDVDADLIFAQQVLGYGKKNDVLLSISTSGNSKNVVNAAYLANRLGLKTIGLTGQKGGKLNDYCDVVIRVPETITSKVQELHLPVYHTLCTMLEEHFFEE